MAVDLKDRVIDDLRACRSRADLVALDERMAVDHRDKPLHRVICEALRDRTIAPVSSSLVGNLDGPSQSAAHRLSESHLPGLNAVSRA